MSAAASAEPPRDRSIAARRAARVAKYERERTIVDYLNRGVPATEIAEERIGVTEKRMRALVKEILARCMPEALEEFAAVQASNEALLVAFGAMSPDNLKAVALVVRIVRELDRYHGFVDAAAGRVGRAQRARVQVAQPETRPETAPQALEGIESTPERFAPAQAAGAAPETGEAQSAQSASHAAELADETSPPGATALRAGAHLPNRMSNGVIASDLRVKEPGGWRSRSRGQRAWLLDRHVA